MRFLITDIKYTSDLILSVIKAKSTYRGDRGYSVWRRLTNIFLQVLHKFNAIIEILDINYNSGK